MPFSPIYSLFPDLVLCPIFTDSLDIGHLKALLVGINDDTVLFEGEGETRRDVVRVRVVFGILNQFIYKSGNLKYRLGRLVYHE